MTRKELAGLVAFNLAALLVIAGLVALSIWQVHRRAWKLDLIDRVETRVHAAPVPAPAEGSWPNVSAATDEYRHVGVTGRWLDKPPALVQAVTELGGGYWVLAPLMRDDGTAMLINRGFIPSDQRASDSWEAPQGDRASVTGLLRLSEPGGTLLRSNDPVADRWFSRDVAAIAASRQLPKTAPYFIDAEPSAGDRRLPVPGLTVISFPNNHLIYAITWAVLALMAFAGAVLVNRDFVARKKSA